MWESNESLRCQTCEQCLVVVVVVVLNGVVMTSYELVYIFLKTESATGDFPWLYVICNWALGAFWLTLCVASSRRQEFGEWLRSSICQPCGKSGFGLQQPLGWSCVYCMIVVWDVWWRSHLDHGQRVDSIPPGNICHGQARLLWQRRSQNLKAQVVVVDAGQRQDSFVNFFVCCFSQAVDRTETIFLMSGSTGKWTTNYLVFKKWNFKTIYPAFKKFYVLSQFIFLL